MIYIKQGLRKFFAGFALSVFFASAQAGEVNVAVAANFATTLEKLTKIFEAESGHKVLISSGSTGKLYAQIKLGAPFDVMLAADSERPQRMEAENLAVAGSRFTYATGRLVLWSVQPDKVDKEGRVLSQDTYRHLAIGNPKTAPYGTAARQVLEKMGLWEKIQPRLVQGEDIGQAFQFVVTGNAELGFVSLAQVKSAESKYPGSYWLVPDTFYQPITQQAVLLDRGRNNDAAIAFLGFLKGKPAQAVIESFGYK
ncbi:molybdate ABC transporter substrate-binding protein [Sulfurirhabdus autotrophica]|uniref:Molybdate transport system substrate-binding protein n=1 Tax=Sulfurirhabdus autotrophica TaxID=1706046 RepID=A0A4R3Y575_9PROT|nr:molybdate ABC transporter substrate-binding protein [Sulfurirhabdus autotrophica]TCV86732.1 molybdate transport system substrate-binding protein [Sulfurirhabdus autotrophica]